MTSIGNPAGISVIMPVYNVARFLGDAVQSVLDQDGVDLELVVVDDGSTDGTSELLKQYANRDPRIVVISQPHSGHPSVARNRGIRESRGELLAFLDGDDLYFPGKLRRTLSVFAQHPAVDIVFHDVRKMSEEGEYEPGTYLEQYRFPSEARDVLSDAGDGVHLASERFYNYASAVYCPFLMLATAVRRSCLERETPWFREDMFCGEDLELWFRLIMKGRVAYIHEPLGAYRQRAGSATKDPARFLLGTLRAHELNLERGAGILSPAERDRYRLQIARRYQYLGYHYLTISETNRARWSYRQSFKVRPEWRSVSRYAKSLMPRWLREIAHSARQAFARRMGRDTGVAV